MKITEKELDRMFTQYLENALIEFEAPHNMNETERLDVYRKAFHKVVKNKLEKKECDNGE